MTSGYITKIKANVNIFATKKTSSILDGTYVSVFMGRSMNFEDLREYVPGDSIRDVDWKASSRSRNLLVKRYIADKKHNILLLMDTGAKMEGDTNTGDNKKEVALFTAGTIAYLAYKNGDKVGSIYNRDGLIQFNQFKTGLLNIERILALYDKEAGIGKTNDIGKSFEYILNNFRRKMIIFVITDLKGMSEVNEAVLKKLMVRHDILFINIGDADMTGREKTFDIDNDHYVPDFIGRNKKLAKLERELKEKMKEESGRKLVRYGIMSTDIDDRKDITEKIIELLEKHKNANIR
ncbi:MAG TPA: DUF58 domain-containing protein [Clostridiales bacterium]|nr:DUF58 domain-containing protein [Clostridiales bacterium]